MKNHQFKYSTMALLLAATLSACGGGGGDPGTVNPGTGTGTTPGTGTTTPGTGTTTPGTGTGATPVTQVAASINFISATPTGQSIVPKGQGGSGRTETGTLTFQVLDASKIPVIAGQKVNFTITPSTADVTLNTPSAITDAAGNVTASVNSGVTSLAFRVVATVDGTTFSTRSDQMSVSTGLPTQRGFSLSTSVFNIEGWNHDSSTTEAPSSLQVLMADASGNPVADGAAVSFISNLGSVGSASRGGCVTVNGGCAVDFRSQNPRVAQAGLPVTPCNTGRETSTPDSTRPGVATVCASSTDGTTTLFDKTELFLSGSFVYHVHVDGTEVATDQNGVLDLGTVKDGDTKLVRLQLSDINLNPLPVKTKVALDGTTPPAGVTFAEEEVSNIAPSNDAGSQGSVHSVAVSSGATGNTCIAKTVTFTLKTTTPLNDVSRIPFKLSFTCS